MQYIFFRGPRLSRIHVFTAECVVGQGNALQMTRFCKMILIRQRDTDMHSRMKSYLADFIQNVKDASTDKRAEKMVRYMLEETAKDCPMEWLVSLGQCLIDCRKEELRDEAARN